jgi:hypothetical protein
MDRSTLLPSAQGYHEGTGTGAGERRKTMAYDDQQDDHNNGSWLLALRENGKGYLGRVSKLDGKDAYACTDDAAKPRSEVPIEEVIEAKVVTLNPVYDYREQVKEVPIIDPKTGKMLADPNTPGIPAMQPVRSPLVMPVGFTLEPAPIHLRGELYDFRFLSQMDKRDAKTCRDFAQETRTIMRRTRLQASGLQAPNGEEIATIAKAHGRPA